MSQHLNTVLEHLRIGCSLKKPKVSLDINNEMNGGNNGGIGDQNTNGNLIKVNGQNCDEIDKSNAHQQPPRTVPNNFPKESKLGLFSAVDFDPRKRYSIPGGPQQLLHENGDLRKSRDLSPVPRNMPRKLSQDMRFRGSNSQLNDDGFDSKLRRPIKTKNVANNYETYDTLHVQAIDVSTKIVFFFFFNSPLFLLTHFLSLLVSFNIKVDSNHKQW